MVWAPRCPPGARGLLALLLLLLPLPGARGITHTTPTASPPGGTTDASGACESPPRFSFAELPGEVNNSYPVGTKLKYSCRSGYTFAPGKSPLVTCLANSTWSADPEFCVGRPCKSLELENGRVHLTDHLFGATANFSCNEGYRLTGPNSVRCVLVESGVDWNKELPRCDAIPCLPPPYIANGFHTGQSEQEFTFGSAVTYKCDQGFSLIGDASIHCTTKNDLNGEWSGPAPECKVVRCPEPEVKNGKKQTGLGPDYSYGNTVIFECDSGYTLTGSNSVKCEANNSWVPFLPTCLSITHTTPTASPPGGTTDTSGSTAKPTDKTTKNTTGLTAKPTDETTKNTTGLTAKPSEETTKNTPGPNTGTMISIGAVIGLLVAGGIVAIVTYKVCFGKKGEDAYHSGGADY